jgi:hypothetical protein
MRIFGEYNRQNAKKRAGKYNYFEIVFRKKYSACGGTPGGKNNFAETGSQIVAKRNNVPKTFQKAYPDAIFQLVTPKNYFEFLK